MQDPWYLEPQPGILNPLENVRAETVKARRAFVRAAEGFIGTQYRLGGADDDGIDCSGLIYAAGRYSGHPIHRVTARRLAQNSKEAAPPLMGDMPIFAHSGDRIAHIGIWKDPERKTMIHASSSKGVIVSTVNEYYWLPRLRGSRIYTGI